MALPPVDVLLSPTTTGAQLPAQPGMELEIPLRPVRLVDLAETQRMRALDRLESYYRLSQDAAKLYDWNGYFYGYGQEAPIKPGWFVPYAKRRPSARYHIARMVVRRLTSLLFGKDRFPELTIPGDAEAEDYARALAVESRLKLRMIEGRNLGGAMGTACFSFCFVDGKPRVEVHNAKHCTVLRWSNEHDHRPAAVLSAYRYGRQVWDPTAQRMRELSYYAVRYWDENIEATWEPIPGKIAETTGWINGPRRVTQHGFGFCPFYWVQNVADSCEPDGEGDYEGFEPDFDEINQILSAVSKGTKSNVDPTLVIKMDPSRNTGNVQKGSENAIFSEGGAEYLELKGQAVQAAVQLLERQRAYTLDALGVVVADPEKLAGSAQSGKALEILYAPMLALADLLREQYGTFGIKPIVVDMMRAARILIARNEAVILPPRVETKKPPKPAPGEPPTPPEEHEEAEVVVVERTPGASEDLTLSWNPYFPPTWEDITKAVTSAQTASGGKPVISQRTAVSTVASLFGVSNVDAELAAIHEDGERAMETAKRAFDAEGGPKPKLEGDEEDDEPEE